MTVNNLDIRRGIEVLERLKQAAADFARREERMTRALEVRRSGIAWRYQAAMSGSEEGEKAALAEVEETFGTQEAHVRRVAAQREARVRRSSAQLLRSLPRKAREARGNWLANLQMRLRQAGTARDEALRRAGAEAAEVSAALGAECERLIALKREASGLSGYKKLSKTPGGPIEAPGGTEGLRMVSEAITEAENLMAEYRKSSGPRILQFARPDAKAAAQVAGEAVLKADRLYETVRQLGAQAHAAAEQAILDEYQRTHAEISDQWTRVDEVETRFQTKGRAKIEAQTPRLLGRIKEKETQQTAVLATGRQRRSTQIRDEAVAQREEAARRHEAEQQQWVQEEVAEWRTLEQQWAAEILPIYAEIRAIQADGRALFPDWAEDWIEAWTPPREFPAGAKFGEMKVDVKTLAGPLPKDPRLSLPGPGEFNLPLALSFPQQGSLLIEGKESGQGAAMEVLNALVMRLLAASPPGKASFTIIDPVGLGQNFAGLMYLADYEESLINRRIWTQQSQIEERLSELNEHIEKVIQMYLRNEYATITEYNEKAGSVAEKYHFLVIADFPAQFSEAAARRLQSIATSGARCGVFTLIQWDQRQSTPEGLAIDELRRASVCVQRRGEVGFFLPGFQLEPGTKLQLEAPPEPELAAKLVHKTGKASVDSNRVEVPFSQISPTPEEMWKNDTTQELKIAIGRTGATKPQYLAIGKGTRQHALFAGKTGSGKSTLFHVIITNLALSCSPEQVEFYLIDFKKGVEFKCYAEKRLPHARVVAIESDREFALSVLQRVDDELRRRGDMFRKLGVQDVAGYKRAGGTENIPRSLLIIDEFQEFFVEDDAVAQNASLLFDRIVRQGRAFGIHVLLGSQTLGGAYTLARATLGQMVIRVALQCNEADAYLIMDDNNSAPRLLSRPGEGIYNDAAGAVEGNSPFQVVWLADEERDRLLEQIAALGESRGIKNDGPIVFEGNAPADIRDNARLREVLEKAPAETPDVGRTWLGAPNSIKGPTEAVFHRQSGNNMLVVGQREEAALSILGLGLLALGAQYPAGRARFIFFQGATDGPGPAFIDGLAKGLPHEVTIVTPHESAAAMNEIATELKQRMSSGAYGAGPVFVFVNGLHKFKKLRHEDDFSFSAEGDGEADPGAQFDELIREGSAYGIHLLVTVDAYSNVTRFISRKGITEFEMRVVFQMSANDSASLIDSPRASGLGLHRALFFNEREGTLETFRPYALPGKGWVEEAVGKLAGRRGGEGVSSSVGVSSGGEGTMQVKVKE